MPTFPDHAIRNSAPDAATMFVAVELSRRSWLVAVQAPPTDKISRHAVPAGDGAALVATIERLRARAERALSAPVHVVSCYEAGFDAFWIHRLLVGHGIENRVIDPVSIQVDRRARRVKTDVVDVEALIRGGVLTDEQIHDLVRYLRHVCQCGPAQ